MGRRRPDRAAAGGAVTGHPTTVGAGDVGTFRVASGQTIEVINTFGGQVVDAWFFAAGDPAEFASMSHSRASLRTIRPAVGSTFVTRRREPLITLVADSSPGIHDMTMPPCDRWRYRQLGAPEHRNCADNLRSALRAGGHGDLEVLPDPLNLFQNSPIDAEGRLTFLESPAPPVPPSACGLTGTSSRTSPCAPWTSCRSTAAPRARSASPSTIRTRRGRCPHRCPISPWRRHRPPSSGGTPLPRRSPRAISPRSNAGSRRRARSRRSARSASTRTRGARRRISCAGRPARWPPSG
ncbi:urea carboxylase-associated family protein [Actinomadura madurae]|uniref:urea carboxylase-associated family protein n=1 Tax=Actinomadura madurae TaxID=1993 RepID=UPI003558AFD8